MSPTKVFPLPLSTVAQTQNYLNTSRKQLKALTSEQSPSTEGNRALVDARKGKAQPWTDAHERHLKRFKTIAQDDYTEGKLSQAFTDFGGTLESEYTKVNSWEKAYLLAKKNKQEETADEIFKHIQERCTAARVSPPTV